MEKDQTKTFEFTEEDYTRIIMTESLFNDSNLRDNGLSLMALKKLQEKEIRLYLHAVTLSDYLRLKKIPRGLRIIKIPMLGKDNETFCDRWCEILNKCSLDLMALTIQETSLQLQNIKEEIKSCKQSLMDKIVNEERRAQMLNDCENWRQSLEKEIKEYKKKKFERDMGDYQRGAVYRWRSSTTDQVDTRPKLASRQRFSNLDLQSASTSSLDSTSTNSEYTFLGHRDAIYKKQRKPKRNADVENDQPLRTSGRKRRNRM